MGRSTGSRAYDPSAALVKAIVVMSAQEIANDFGVTEYPNNLQGYGRVAFDDVLYFDGDSAHLLVIDEDWENPNATDDTAEYRVNVTQGEPFRVVLNWLDEAALACSVVCNSTPVLINDFDLEVEDSNGRIYKGNVFSGDETPHSMGARDYRNNTEAVFINAPGTDTLTVRVRAYDVSSVRGGTFALAIRGDVRWE